MPDKPRIDILYLGNESRIQIPRLALTYWEQFETSYLCPALSAAQIKLRDELLRHKGQFKPKWQRKCSACGTIYRDSVPRKTIPGPTTLGPDGLLQQSPGTEVEHCPKCDSTGTLVAPDPQDQNLIFAQRMMREMNLSNQNIWDVLAMVIDDCAITDDLWLVAICEYLIDEKTGVLHRKLREVIRGHPNICLTGDTKIPLLDGSVRTIADLAASGLRDFWTYGCTDYGRVMGTRIKFAQQTGVQRDVVRVTLDSGESVTCTPDHRFMLRDGTYCEAGKLVPGTSLMPLYTGVDKAGYEYIRQPYQRGFPQATHVAVHYGHLPTERGHHIHHVNRNQRDNRPENLKRLTAAEHRREHYKDVEAEWRAYLESPEGKAHSQRQGRRLGELARMPEGRARAAALAKELGYRNKGHPRYQTEAHRGQCRKAQTVATERRRRNGESPAQVAATRAMHEGRDRQTPEQRRESGLKSAVTRKERGYVVSEETRAKRGAAIKAAYASRPQEWKDARAAKISATKQAKGQSEAQKAGAMQNLEKARLANPRLREKYNNHKVVSVEPAGTADVYDLIGSETENFGLSAGVFVHNCRFVSDGKGNLGGAFLSCPRHRNFVYNLGMTTAAKRLRGYYYVDADPIDWRKAPRYCPKCEEEGFKVELRDVWYVATEAGGQKPVAYYFKDEVLHKSRFRPSLLYGTSPVVTLYREARALIKMEEYIQEYFEKRMIPRGMVVIRRSSTAPAAGMPSIAPPQQAVDVFKQDINKRMQDEWRDIPFVGVSHADDIQFLPFADKISEMEYIPVREEFKRNIGSFMGLSPLFMAQTESGGGLQNQSEQITVTNRAIEPWHIIFNDGIFPWFLNLCNVHDWVYELERPERQDLIDDTRVELAQTELALQKRELGFQVLGWNAATKKYVFSDKPDAALSQQQQQAPHGAFGSVNHLGDESAEMSYTPKAPKEQDHEGAPRTQRKGSNP